MLNVELSYNPFLKEKQFIVNGTKDSFEECWGRESTELSEWCNVFFSKLYEKYNEDEFQVHFKGITRDFEFLEDARLEYIKKCPKQKIELINCGCSNVADRFSNLKKLFKRIQKESPYEELKTPTIKELFKKATSNEFEVAVVATMSSGKSTLINSMLGVDLLPARNAATTAVLARIHDVDGADHFEGASYDKEGKELIKCNPLTLENTDRLNDDKNTSYIEITGDIPSIDSSVIQLVLTDTPGPNNSTTSIHAQHTYELIKSDYKPMILYVLNATQLTTNDNNQLLSDLAKMMKEGGRQSTERIMFVLNKADALDSQKGETLESVINSTKAYLCRYGINDAKVYPTAAYMAKIIRQHLNNQKMTECEEDDLEGHTKFIKREQRHLSNYSPLSKTAKEQLDQEFRNAKEEENTYKQSLIYTGVPSVELAINEYLQKYAVPAKITEASFAFKTQLENLSLRDNTMKKLNDDEAERCNTIKKLDEIESQLKNGSIAKIAQEQISKISLKNNINKLLEEANTNMKAELTPKLQELKLRIRNLDKEKAKKEAEAAKQEIEKAINKSFETFQYKLETDLKREIHNSAQKIIDENVKTIKKFINISEFAIDENMFTKEDLSKSMSEKILLSYSKYKNTEILTYNKKEKFGGIAGGAAAGALGVGGALAFLTPIGIGLAIGAGVAALCGGGVGALMTADEEYTTYDFNRYIDESVFPQVNKILQEIKEKIYQTVEQETNKLQVYTKNLMVRLEDTIRIRAGQQKEILSDKEKLQQAIKNNKSKLLWLTEVQKELDDILSI